jgi:hypothetical protein
MTTNSLLPVWLRVTIVALLFSSSILAHHSASRYDREHLITIKGKVISFEWTNPHSHILLDVMGADGKTTRWRLEASPVNMLIRAGWTKDTLKAGDIVTVNGPPGRHGEPIMQPWKVVLPNGKELVGVFS